MRMCILAVGSTGFGLVTVNERACRECKKYKFLLFCCGAEHSALLFSMLTDLDEDLDAAAEKMGMVMGSLAKLLKTKGALLVQFCLLKPVLEMLANVDVLL